MSLEANTKARRRRRGFGLIEVMISAGILAVAMAGIMSLLANLEDQYTHQKLVSQALHIGESTMEDLLVRYADDAQLASGTFAGPSYSLQGQPGGTFFTTSWVVQSGVPFSEVRTVTVTVQWSEKNTVTGTSAVKKFSLTTVRT